MLTNAELRIYSGPIRKRKRASVRSTNKKPESPQPIHSRFLRSDAPCRGERLFEICIHQLSCECGVRLLRQRNLFRRVVRLDVVIENLDELGNDGVASQGAEEAAIDVYRSFGLFERSRQ